MSDFLPALRRFVFPPPERRWWGFEWLPHIGGAVGSWYWIVENRPVTGLIIVAGAAVLEISVFHGFVKSRRRQGE